MKELPISAAIKMAWPNYKSILLLSGSALCMAAPAASWANGGADSKSLRHRLKRPLTVASWLGKRKVWIFHASVMVTRS